LCDHTNLKAFCESNEEYFHLIDEWDTDSNGDMEQFSPHNDDIVKWICKNDKNWCDCHEWDASVKSRTSENGSNCPYCVNQKLCPHNNLKYFCETNEKYRYLINEWDASHNGAMENYSPGSISIAKWLCSRPKNSCACHSWKTQIYHRTRKHKESGCPNCYGRKVCPHSNLETFCKTNSKYSHLCNEWHNTLNDQEMIEFAPHSNTKVWWICKIETCKNIWETTVAHRTGRNGTNCPKCNQSKGEINISAYLEKNGIKFEKEKRLDKKLLVPKDVKGDNEIHDNLKRYRYDFYLPEYNSVIEFDGVQHFKPSFSTNLNLNLNLSRKNALLIL